MKIDESNMRKVILDFPGQFKVGLEAAEKVGIKKAFEKVLVCGMGGSALPADILSMWLDFNEINLPLRIHRNYGLPAFADKKCLVIFISYSGNTEETLSGFNEAKRKGLEILAISSGGKLAELCEEHLIPIAKIPSGFQPRMALGFQFAALMKILVNCGLIEGNLTEISSLENSLKPENIENRGKELAEKLKNKIILIYSSEKFEKLARIWKIKFNENSKVPAFSNNFPELNHNEQNQFEWNENGKFAVLAIQNKDDHPRILKRVALLDEILKSRGIQTQLIDIEGKDVLYKIFNNILLSDWASYYLALEYGIDPTPVRLNDEFKEKLAK